MYLLIHFRRNLGYVFSSFDLYKDYYYYYYLVFVMPQLSEPVCNNSCMKIDLAKPCDVVVDLLVISAICLKNAKPCSFKSILS